LKVKTKILNYMSNGGIVKLQIIYLLKLSNKFSRVEGQTETSPLRENNPVYSTCFENRNEYIPWEILLLYGNGRGAQNL